jgi:hypothetical protein
MSWPTSDRSDPTTRLETLADPHWSELTAYLVELEIADAADIFLYWEYRTLLRGWGRADFQPEYTLARLNVGEPEVGAALWKRDKGKRCRGDGTDPRLNGDVGHADDGDRREPPADQPVCAVQPRWVSGFPVCASAAGRESG